MTTISRTAAPAPELTSTRRIVNPGKGDAGVFVKARELTADQKADLASRKAYFAELEAKSQTASLAAEKRNKAESHEMYLPNISDLSLEDAKKSLEIVEVMIKNKGDVGLNIHGRYGDQKITDLKSYTTAVKDFISKHQTTVPDSTSVTLTAASQVANAKAPQQSETNANFSPVAPSQSSSAAAALYRQIQDQVDTKNDGN